MFLASQCNHGNNILTAFYSIIFYWKHSVFDQTNSNETKWNKIKQEEGTNILSFTI